MRAFNHHEKALSFTYGKMMKSYAKLLVYMKEVILWVIM